MPFGISFARSFNEVPPPVLVRLRQLLRDVVGSLDTIPKTAAVWESILLSGMLIEVDGWRFRYRINADARMVIVQEVKAVGK